MQANDTTSFGLLGKRWSALIVHELIAGPLRFRELLSHLSLINDKVLSQRLKELEGANILKRQVFAEVPIRVEYSLSEKGRGLASVIREMERWDTMWSGKNGRSNGKSAEPKRAAEPEPVGAAEAAQGSQSRSAVEGQAPERPKAKRSLWQRLGL